MIDRKLLTFSFRGQPSYYGETPLGFACCTEQWNIVEILLKHGADVNVVRYPIKIRTNDLSLFLFFEIDGNGNTILHVLVICNLAKIYEKFKNCWIDRCSDEKIPLWNRRNVKQLTPLTLAADLGRYQMLSWLLEERKQIQWSYGDISCVLHPLDQLDLDLRGEVKTKNF